MSKREKIATYAMAAIIAGFYEPQRPAAVAKDAVKYADALIAALGEGQ